MPTKNLGKDLFFVISLSIELLYESEVIDPLIVSLNQTDIWHYFPVYSNKQTIIDSQFNIPDYETNIIWLHLYINQESSNINKQLVLDKKVLLFKGNKDKDMFGRSLRYVVLAENSIFINGFMFRLDAPHDGRNALGWHQDSSYYQMSYPKFNSGFCWIPLTNNTIKNANFLWCCKVFRAEH